MNLDTFLLLQRARVAKVDKDPLDDRVRRLHFDDPSHHDVHKDVWVPAPMTISSRDSIKTGYRNSRILYE